VWFKALPRIDRVLVDLTIKVAENIHSSLLAKGILSVVGKLEGLLESSVLISLESFGRQFAERLGFTAQKWGNTSAINWAGDSSFAVFLAVTHIRNDFRCTRWDSGFRLKSQFTFKVG